MATFDESAASVSVLSVPLAFFRNAIVDGDELMLLVCVYVPL